MKQKINIRYKFLVLAALTTLGAATTGLAQASNGSTQVPVPQRPWNRYMSSNLSSGVNYGLIGQKYYGFDFGYTHHVQGPPSVLHRYGFAANNPFAPGYDVGLKYDWTTANAFGRNASQQEVAIPLTAYLYNGWGRPFLEADAGWRWVKGPGPSDDSFAYLLGAGVELQVSSPLVVTPYVNYREAANLHARAWSYGVKANLQVMQEWSVHLGAQIDEHNNIEYAAGFNLHY